MTRSHVVSASSRSRSCLFNTISRDFLLFSHANSLAIVSLQEETQKREDSARIAMTCTSNLPSELLIEIFRLATDGPVRDIDSLVSWTPFDSHRAAITDKNCRDSIRTKHALALVCSSFRRLSLELLYEDIWIRHGSDGLLQALESSKSGDQLGLGGYVRRVSFSLEGNVGSRQSRDAIYKNAHRILSCCPNVRAISRPQEPLSYDDTLTETVTMPGLSSEDLDFPFLHRVDWHNTPQDVPFASAPSPQFIWHLQSLQVLIIGSDNFPDLPNEQNPDPVVVNLPNVHTLGIRSLNVFGSETRRHYITLPSLRRLVAGHPEAIFSFFTGWLAPLGHQITSIELDRDPRFLRHDFVATLLGYCPNTAELYIPIWTTRPISINQVPRVVIQFAVRHVYLHVGATEGFDFEETPWRALVQEHFEGLCGVGSRFVQLEHITLCGTEWKSSIEDTCFQPILQRVLSKGILLDCEDAELQRVLFKSLPDVNKVIALS